MPTSIIQYTSPSIPFVVDIDLTDAQILVTFEQGDITLTKRASDVVVTEGTTSFIIDLEQAETAEFNIQKPVEVQINWIYINGKRGATEPRMFPVLKNLLDEVISYGD